MAHTITLIPGDGIGPEVTEAVVRIFKVAGLQIEWERHDAGVTAFKRFNQSLPVELLDSIRKNKVALKGPVTTPIAEGFTSVNVGLRKALDLYANLRPVKNLEGVASRFQGVDLVIVRENTEDLYSGLEHEVIPGVVESLKIITEKASTRIAKFAFEHARGNGRKRVTAIHKANILKLGDGLFLRSIRDVACEYTDIGYDEKIIDAACMSLVMTPEKFDVLVLPNLYGDIVSDLGAGLVGGLGVAPGANIGSQAALFEPTHGSAPKYAGMNKVNPIAMMLSGVMMLRHLKEIEAAERMEGAIADIIREGESVTYDMKPHRDDPTAVGTSEVADAIIEKLKVAA
jgi:isocitrate dehydrogenase (NAD+)